MKIEDYFASLERSLRQNRQVSHLQEPFTCLASAGQRVFRYDNAPHHPEIVTFPHHKHIGPQDRVAPSDQPSLSQVLAEIASWLEQHPPS
ncbi:MAG: DUF6516 family protein [Anaerolineae bacterium]